MPIEIVPYDTAEHLKTDEDVALYIEAALEDGDPALSRDAIGIVARARGMAQAARATGLTGEGLSALSREENPGFDTIARALKTLAHRTEKWTPLFGKS